MLYFLTTQPLWQSAAILVGLTTLLASFGPSLARYYVPFESLTDNNEIAGFKFATVGVLYAVLLAFAIIVVWEKYSQAEDTVAQEAGAAAAIYRLSDGLGDKGGGALRDALTNYLTIAIAVDWPDMDRDRIEARQPSRQAMNAIYATLLTIEVPDSKTNAFAGEILRQLDAMTQARRSRIVAAEGAVPGIIWLVLFGGAVLTIVFTFFFGTRNLRAQTLMTSMLSVLIFSELLIIVAIDRPFTGTVKVEPTALVDVLADFKSGPPTGQRP
jgi:hypothetical protein